MSQCCAAVGLSHSTDPSHVTDAIARVQSIKYNLLYMNFRTKAKKVKDQLSKYHNEYIWIIDNSNDYDIDNDMYYFMRDADLNRNGNVIDYKIESYDSFLDNAGNSYQEMMEYLREEMEELSWDKNPIILTIDPDYNFEPFIHPASKKKIHDQVKHMLYRPGSRFASNAIDEAIELSNTGDRQCEIFDYGMFVDIFNFIMKILPKKEQTNVMRKLSKTYGNTYGGGKIDLHKKTTVIMNNISRYDICAFIKTNFPELFNVILELHQSAD